MLDVPAKMPAHVFNTVFKAVNFLGKHFSVFNVTEDETAAAGADVHRKGVFRHIFTPNYSYSYELYHNPLE